MSKATRKPAYSMLARYYDQLFGVEHLKIMSRARRRLLGKILRRARSACDLACGTGNAAMELARRGVRVWAVDLSPEMCRITRDKARREALKVEVIEADMRAFRLPAPVDLVLCEFDALNHLPQSRDLGRVVRAAARALRPGGHFYFDVNTMRAFEELWTHTWYSEFEAVKLIAIGGCDKKRRRGWSEMHWFIPEGELYRCVTERYEEVCWSESRLERELRSAGFGEIQKWDSSQVIPGVEWFRPGCRFFCLARKGG